jgi:hypothetical protein
MRIGTLTDIIEPSGDGLGDAQDAETVRRTGVKTKTSVLGYLLAVGLLVAVNGVLLVYDMWYIASPQTEVEYSSESDSS